MGHKTQLSRGIPDIGTKTIGGRAAVFVSLPLSVDAALVRYRAVLLHDPGS